MSPTISSISPTSNAPGQTIIIYGSAFGSGDTVYLNQNGQIKGSIYGPSIQSVNSNELILSPNLLFANLSPGSYQVTVSNGSTISNAVNFTINSSTQTTTTTTITASPVAQSTVSSANATVQVGQAFTPSYYGGNVSGNWQFTVVGHTNWNPGVGHPTGTDLGTNPSTDSSSNYSSSWTPTAAGTYTFYVANNGNSNFLTSNIAGPYTLTVNPAPQTTTQTVTTAITPVAQSTVSSASASVTLGQSFTPSYYGGSGYGNWGFTVVGYTNWNPGANHPSGTDLGTSPSTEDREATHRLGLRLQPEATHSMLRKMVTVIT